MAGKLICFYSQKIWIVTIIAFFKKEAHLKRTAVYCGKSGLCLSNQIGSKKELTELQNSVHDCQCGQLGNMAVYQCIRSVRYYWIIPRSPTLEGVVQSQLVSFYSFLLSTSRRLHLNSTLRLLRLHTRPHLFVPNLTRTSILNKRPIWSYPLSGRLFGDLLALFFYFIRFLLQVI